MSFGKGMEPETLGSGAAFSDTLRSFKTGQLSRGELLSAIDRQLALGTSAGDLRKTLQDFELVARLSSDVREAVMERINNWHPPMPGSAAHLVDAPTRVLQQAGVHGDSRSAPLSIWTSVRRSSVTVGDVLQARFSLVELIGEGGMSRVYKAVDLRRIEAGSHDPHIAVKVLTLPFNEYFGSIAALQSEAQKLQSLAHPNIVRVFDCDRDGEIVFMTMEYIVGTRLLAGHPTRSLRTDVGQQKAESIIMAIADAVEYAHRNHVVHGDLKPGNVLVTVEGQVKVIDFGVARWLVRPDAALERRDVVQNMPALAATARYASPQVMARQPPLPADDVYALACLAYLLLTGSHPFANNGAMASRSPPPQLDGLTTSQYSAIVRALQFERNARTATVREFIEDFAAKQPVRSWGKRSVWLSVAVLVILAAWLFSRYSTMTETAQTPAINDSGQATSSHLAPIPGTVIRDCPTCPIMTVLPSGRFKQGSASGSGALSFEQPQHPVSIAYAFAISPHEITVGDFREFIVATGHDMQGCDTYDGKWQHQLNASWKDPGFAQGTTHPVTCASWNDAIAYAQWLSAKSGHRYRLPSASEWEYAARAGTDAVHPWNSSGAACAEANVADQSAARRYPGWDVFACDDGYVNTAPVGSFSANAFGLSDMLGNVFEWTQDCWHEDYSGAPTDGSARTDGDCNQRELRGGSWFSSPSYVTVSYRNHFAADYRASSVGFRLVRDISP
jgi:formylglycine-generating enzyme required for sulfatase activity